MKLQPELIKSRCGDMIGNDTIQAMEPAAATARQAWRQLPFVSESPKRAVGSCDSGSAFESTFSG
jgi:hypothetical protein